MAALTSHYANADVTPSVAHDRCAWPSAETGSLPLDGGVAAAFKVGDSALYVCEWGYVCVCVM